MGLIGYDFFFQDAQGIGKADIPFAQTGAIGSPGIVSLKTHDLAHTDITPSLVSFLNLGSGYYAAFYDPAAHGEAFLIIDGGGGVAPSNRYQGRTLAIDSGLLVAAISVEGRVQGLDAHALDVVEFPADLTDVSEAKQLVVQGIAYGRHAWRHSRIGADGTYLVLNDAGDTIDTIAVDSTGGVLSITPED